MLIDIKKIGLQGLMLQDRVAPDENMLIEDDSYFLDELDYSIHLAREGEKIRARGRIRTVVSLRCVSCLDGFELKVDSKFDVILFPVYMMEEKSSTTPLNPEEMEYIFFEGEEIDLERLLMEQVNLFIPFNPMCSDYCKGICPNCGVNLNYETCHCENKVNEMSIFLDKIKR